jgi:hypothetical protein
LYPQELRDRDSCYPLAPENIDVTKEMLSPAALAVLGDRPFSTGRRLVPHLGPRLNYVVFGHTLHYYLSRGLRITKVHKVIYFKQSAWLKQWITLNTDLRRVAKAAGNEFRTDLFKMMNNSVFGKTMEDVRGHIRTVVVYNSQVLLKHVAKPSFRHFIELSAECCIVVLGVDEVKLDKPIYTGGAVLDLSKELMYQHWARIKDVFGPAVKLAMTDTDSLVIDIEHPHHNELLKLLQPFLDCSVYAECHVLYDPSNEGVVGTLKDEYPSDRILTRCNPSAKVYMLTTSLHELRKCKGISKAVIPTLTLEDFMAASSGTRQTHVEFKRLRSINHTMFLQGVRKVALTGFDCKRFWLESGESLPYGHYSLQETVSDHSMLHESDSDL